MKRVSMVMAGVAFCTLFAVSASAEANLALRGIGLKAGFVNPEDLGTTVGFGLMADLGTLHPQVALESYAGYWQQTESDFGTEFGVKDFTFGGKAKYLFETSNPSVQPFAGAGLGFHVLNAHVDLQQISPGLSDSETDFKLGFDVGGGLRYDNGGQFSLLGEAWYTAVSDVSHFSLMLGAVYMFGR